MPVLWQSTASSQRLLSAIFAAHPTLKASIRTLTLTHRLTDSNSLTRKPLPNTTVVMPLSLRLNTAFDSTKWKARNFGVPMVTRMRKPPRSLDALPRTPELRVTGSGLSGMQKRPMAPPLPRMVRTWIRIPKLPIMTLTHLSPESRGPRR